VKITLTSFFYLSFKLLFRQETLLFDQS